MINGALLLTLLFLAYALFSRSLSRSSITGPMIFVAAGILAGVEMIGSGAPIATFSLELESETIQILLEGTLVIVLFADAALIDVRKVRQSAFLPTRLLLIGLPLTMIVGTAVAMGLFPGLGFWGAAIVAIVLAPTDAALGQAVVSNGDVPDLVRQGLGIESGLNDGLVVPFLAIAVAGAAGDLQTGGEIIDLFLREIGIAIVIGVAIGWAGAWLVHDASRRGWTGREGRQVFVLFLAILCAIVAEPLGASAFISAFVGGAAFGRESRKRYPDICHFSEGMGHLLTMLAFFVFGGLILLPNLDDVTWQVVVYALASLTIIRMIPVMLALLGTKVALPTTLFVGWFGPRGLASLVFMGTVVVQTAPEVASAVLTIGSITVAGSVLLHGLTAWPWSIRYAGWYRRAEDEEPGDMVEGMDVEPMMQRRMDGRLAMMGESEDA